jgi:hypothetical protein
LTAFFIAEGVSRDYGLRVQVRTFIDGPRGFLAEVLRVTKVNLSPELSEKFSYLAQAGTARSNKGSLTSRGRGRKTASCCNDSVASRSSSLLSKDSKVHDGKLLAEEIMLEEN